MIPQNLNNIDIEITTETSNTYVLKTTKGRIFDFTYDDNLAAMAQAIYKILNTERYENPIYSFNYGVELAELFGKPKEYAIPEIERRIKEALLQDDRITSIDNFDFSLGDDKKNVVCSFEVVTIFGKLETTKEVSL